MFSSYFDRIGTTILMKWFIGFIKYTVDELSSKYELENLQAIKVIGILDETSYFSWQNSEKLGD